MARQESVWDGSLTTWRLLGSSEYCDWDRVRIADNPGVMAQWLESTANADATHALAQPQTNPSHRGGIYCGKRLRRTSDKTSVGSKRIKVRIHLASHQCCSHSAIQMLPVRSAMLNSILSWPIDR